MVRLNGAGHFIGSNFVLDWLVQSDEFLYKTTDYWCPEFERILLWSDLEVGIKWPLDIPPKLGVKDAEGGVFAKAETFD